MVILAFYGSSRESESQVSPWKEALGPLSFFGTLNPDHILDETLSSDMVF